MARRTVAVVRSATDFDTDNVSSNTRSYAQVPNPDIAAIWGSSYEEQI